MKYWLPFSADSGAIWIEGPFETREQAMAEREKAKSQISPLSKVGSPFVADNKDDALKRAHLFL